MIERVQAEDIQIFDEPSSLIKEDTVSEKSVKKIKVSTGCGPSPDREIEEILFNEHNESTPKAFTPLRDIPSRSSKVSIGTSPPPQSMSTQVILRALIAFNLLFSSRKSK